MTKTIIRRVRLDLPQIPPDPYAGMLAKLPYRQWLISHVEEIKALSDDTGNQLVAEVKPRTGKTVSGTVFVTDFVFGSEAQFQYYNTHCLSAMRGRIEDSYPGATAAGSPFIYRIATQAEPDTFTALLEGIADLEPV